MHLQGLTRRLCYSSLSRHILHYFVFLCIFLTVSASGTSQCQMSCVGVVCSSNLTGTMKLLLDYRGSLVGLCIYIFMESCIPKLAQQKIKIFQTQMKLNMFQNAFSWKESYRSGWTQMNSQYYGLAQTTNNFIKEQVIYNNKMQSDKIFYVLPHDITHFHSLNTSLSCTPLSAISTSSNSQAITNALKYRYPLKYLGKQAEQLLVVCIPADEHEVHQIKEKQSELPLLIKTNQETERKGYKSGRRSAIVEIEGKLIRYKGCGNDGDGFIYENQQLRGSHFYHTAKRELHMTRLINQILQKETGQRSGNESLFFYEYPRNIDNLGLRNDIRLLNKYCCVFETQGDRRVGTHLISPLQIIFLNIMDPKELNLQQFFAKKQRLDQYGLSELLMDFQLFLQSGQTFIDKYDQGRQFQNYVNLSEVNSIGEIRQSDQFSEIINKISQKFIKKQILDLNNLLSSQTNWIPIIQTILQKLGWEMGQVKRVFCQNSINWGFFNDHNMWHCNAHLNNFIIKKPVVNAHFILPLDFDLAFTKNEYINIDFDSQKYGQHDDDNFQQLLLAQYNAMQTSISGVEIMNFNYSIDLQQKQNQPSLLVKMKRVIFRDTLIKSFRHGMRRNQQEYDRINKKWNQNIDSITKLVQSCLRISAQFQT